MCIWAGLIFPVLGVGATGGLWLVGTLLSGCGFMFLQVAGHRIAGLRLALSFSGRRTCSETDSQSSSLDGYPLVAGLTTTAVSVSGGSWRPQWH